MFWLVSAALANCVPLGSLIIIAATIGLGATYRLPARPVTPVPPPARPLIKPVSKDALLPKVRPYSIPIPPLDCAKDPCLAVTFDDGPDPRTTPKILDVLAKYQAKATFFVLGSRVAKYPELTQRIVQEGHEIGNHSWGHKDFTQMNPKEMMRDIAQAQRALAAAGVRPPRFFRPPYGARNAAVRKTVPLTFVLWSMDPEDWRASNPKVLTKSLVTAVKPGDIVVLHDIKPVTVAASPHFIAKLSRKYRLVTVSQLLKLPPHKTLRGEYTSR